MPTATPIFPQIPKAPATLPTLLTTANTAKDGTGTVVQISETAGASGAFCAAITALPIGTNTASVLRIFLNNGGANTTAANNILWKEVSLPATALSEVAAQTPVVIPVGEAIPAGFRLYATIGTTVAAGWRVLALTGDY